MSKEKPAHASIEFGPTSSPTPLVLALAKFKGVGQRPKVFGHTGKINSQPNWLAYKEKYRNAAKMASSHRSGMRTISPSSRHFIPHRCDCLVFAYDRTQIPGKPTWRIAKLAGVTLISKERGSWPVTWPTPFPVQITLRSHRS